LAADSEGFLASHLAAINKKILDFSKENQLPGDKSVDFVTHRYYPKYRLAFGSKGV
jgi:hypothetical protein